MDIKFLAFVLCVAGLLPCAAYVLGRRVDPFNPALFVGGLTFGVCAFKPLIYTQDALTFVTAHELAAYLVVCLVSLLAFYGGCLYARRRAQINSASLPQRYWQMDARRILMVALLFGLVADLSYVLTYHQYRATGYLRDLSALRLPAAVLAIQAAMYDRQNLRAAALAIAMGLAPSVMRFFTYGGRGVTVEMLLFLLVPFLFRGRRPAKVLVISVGLLGGFAVHYLATTRMLIGSGEAKNRISALILAFEGHHAGGTHVSGGSTFVEGALELATVRKLGNYDKGGVLWNFAVVFLPHEWFPNKYDYVTPWALSKSRMRMVDNTEGVLPPEGTAPSGYTDMFIEFGWLAPIFWFLVGWFSWRVYMRGVVFGDVAAQGYYVALLFGLLYLVAQQIEPGIQNWLFSYVPLALAYWQCRLPSAAGSLPASSGRTATAGGT